MQIKVESFGGPENRSFHGFRPQMYRTEATSYPPDIYVTILCVLIL